MRMELTRIVSGRLAVPESVFEQRLAAAEALLGRGARSVAWRRAWAGSSRRGASGQRRAGQVGCAAARARRHRAGVPGAVHRCTARRASGRWRRWTSTSTSPAICCAARPGICVRAICASRWRPPRRTRPRLTKTASSARCWPSWSCRAVASPTHDRPSSRPSACSWSSRASIARSSVRAGAERRDQRPGQAQGDRQTRLRSRVRARAGGDGGEGQLSARARTLAQTCVPSLADNAVHGPRRVGADA